MLGTTLLACLICGSGAPALGDGLDVKSLGAPLDGSGDDGPAFSAARAQAKPGEEISVPAGLFHPSTAVTGGPQDAVFWRMHGVSFGKDGRAPVYEIGHDLVSNILKGGTQLLSRGTDTKPNVGPILRIDRSINYSSGTVGVVAALTTNCRIDGSPKNYFRCNQTVVRSKAAGSSQHLAVAGSIFRPSDALDDKKGPRAQIWAGYFENNDQTGQASETAGSQVGIENDIYANGGDAARHRIILQMNIGKSHPTGEPAQAGYGVTIGSSDGQSAVGSGYDLSAPFTVAAFDASRAKAVNGAPAFRMAEGQRFCLDGENRNCLAAVHGRIAFSVRQRPELELVEHGGLRFANYATDPQTIASASGAIYFNTTYRALRVFDGRAWAFVTPQSGKPASSHSPCSTGEQMYDARYAYLCVAPNEWRRQQLETF